MNTFLGAVYLGEMPPLAAGISKTLGSNEQRLTRSHGTMISNQPIFEHGPLVASGCVNTLSRVSGTGMGSADQGLIGFLESWKHQGVACLDQWDGAFALILWDWDAEQVWAVRDLFGAMPLHYTASEREIAYASHPDRLWNLPSAKIKINQDRILDYIIDDLEHVDQVSTFKTGIRKVPIGGVTQWHQGQCDTRQYWEPELDPSSDPDSPQAILASFQALLAQSIRNKQDTQHPSGLLLSGGLDSNAVLSTWQPRSTTSETDTCHLLSLIPESGHRTDPESRMLLDQSKRHQDHPYHWVIPSEAVDLLGPVETFVHQLEDPFALHTLSGPAPCYRKASELGIQQVMDGVDGDLVGGMPSGYWNDLWKEGQRRESVRECYGYFRHQESSIPFAMSATLKLVLKHGFGFRRNPRRQAANSHAGSMREAAETIESYDIQQRTFSTEQLADRFEKLRTNHHPTTPRSWKESVVHGLKSPMLGVAVDRYRIGSEALGVHAIHPLLDRPLVEFLLKLSWPHRIRRGAPKQLFRASIQSRGWTDCARQKELGHVGPWFTHAFCTDYLKRHPQPKPECLDAIHPYVDAKRIEQAWKQAVQSPEYQSLDEFLWRMIMLGEWLITHG